MLRLPHALGPRSKPYAQLVGRSAEIVALRQEIERVARSDAKVLITGESGVGKEIVARGIHFNGPRAQMMFAPVNCAGLPETLLESELFGHVKGSFTGAYRDKPGKFESAHMGTVFLDEIGEMTLRMQGLLLRFLETGELQRVGADGSRHVNVRLIGATNRNLKDMVGQGTFREDLYYRLNVIKIEVPPLRDHRDDVPMLVQYFLDRFVAANQSPITGISPDAMKSLVAYSWPGNVRELENLIERIVVTIQHSTIEPADLPSEVAGAGAGGASAPQGAPPHRGRRSVRTARGEAGIVLVDGVSALHGPRDHAKQRSRDRSTRSRGSERELQDRRPAVQPRAAGIQALPQLPQEARLPAAVQGISLSRKWVHARDLLRQLIARDIKLRYQGSLLGIAWTLLNPLAELSVLLFVFGFVLRVDIPNYSAYLFTGLIVYGWFQTSVNFATNAIVGNRELVRRPGVPSIILPIVTVASNLVHFLLSLPILFVLLIWNQVPLTGAIAALPALVAIEFILILGFAYPVSILHVWFRDTQHVLRVGLQLLFYLTPIFYERSLVPSALQWLYRVNPLAHLIDSYRAVLLRGEWPNPTSLLFLLLFASALCLNGIFWFRRVSPRFPDEL